MSDASTLAMPPPAKSDSSSDPSVRPMLFRLGVQISLALVNGRSLPEEMAARLGTDLAWLKRVLAGDETAVSLDMLMAIARDTGSRLEVNLVQPAQPRPPS